MPAPVFQWSESNGATPTVTDNQTNGVVFASADSNSNTSNLATTNPITAGNNSYEKWWRMKITSVADNGVSSFGVYFSSTAPTDSGSSSAHLAMYFATNHSYVQPVATVSTIATTLCSTVTSGPGTSFTAPANTANSYSGYIIQQLQVSSSATGGNCTFASPWMTAAYTYN
jgi:hypothetical protein